MTISYEDFSKLEVKIGTVIAVEAVPETDRLLKFEVDLGSEKRTIVGGWAKSYPDPQVLVGKQLPVLVNLEPRTIRGIESQGMLLSAVQDDLPIALYPEKAVDNGAGVR
jgi:methionine--tRNA ligase beta chain